MALMFVFLAVNHMPLYTGWSQIWGACDFLLPVVIDYSLHLSPEGGQAELAWVAWEIRRWCTRERSPILEYQPCRTLSNLVYAANDVTTRLSW